MWPFNGGSTSTTTTNINNNNNNGFSGFPPSRSSSSTCSSASPDESSTPRQSMEEVWNDINLPSLEQDQTQLTTHKHNNPFILQDFPPGSFKDPLTTTTTTSTSARGLSLRPFDSFAGTLTPLNSLPPHPPATILSLNSPGSDHPMPSSRPQLLHGHFSIGDTVLGSSSSLSSASDLFGSSPVLPSSFKKRTYGNGEESGDRRHKRMIKNRESAARSRAYTNELEHEVNRLLEENAKLKSQHQRFLAAIAQLPKKRALQRTLTAPF